MEINSKLKSGAFPSPPWSSTCDESVGPAFSRTSSCRCNRGCLKRPQNTFIGTLSDLTQKQKEEIQNLLVRKFPSISILDVERTGQAILSVVKQMTWALQVMAALSILAGLVILFCVSREKAYRQRWELNLLKVLGASFGDLRNQVRLEFGMLGLAASMAGASLSTLVSYVFAEIIFDRVWSFHWGLPISISLVVIALSVLTAEWGMRQDFGGKTRRIAPPPMKASVSFSFLLIPFLPKKTFPDRVSLHSYRPKMTKDNIQQKENDLPGQRFPSRIPQSLQAGIDLARRLRESPPKRGCLSLMNERNEDTLWQTMVYDQHYGREIFEGLKQIYVLFSSGGDKKILPNLYVDRDYCTFGNTRPFRIRIVNQYNDNHDYFYAKKADASRIYGLELEQLLSPTKSTFKSIAKPSSKSISSGFREMTSSITSSNAKI